MAYNVVNSIEGGIIADDKNIINLQFFSCFLFVLPTVYNSPTGFFIIRHLR